MHKMHKEISQVLDFQRFELLCNFLCRLCAVFVLRFNSLIFNALKTSLKRLIFNAFKHLYGAGRVGQW